MGYLIMRTTQSPPEDREVLKQRILKSDLMKTGEGFSSADVAKLLRKTNSCATMYLKQMVDDQRLTAKVVYTPNRTYRYFPAAPKVMSMSWRIDESIYEELEEELEYL